MHALVYLKHKDCLLSSEELADNICTNPVRVRKVLCKLKVSGLVQTKEGAEGGYRFAGDAKKITLADIAQALGTPFVEMNWRSGSYDKPCLVSSGMAGIMDGIVNDLNKSCMEYLQGITIAQIEEDILRKARSEVT